MHCSVIAAGAAARDGGHSRTSFHFARLAELGRQLERGYLSAEPFPHVVIDDLFDPAVLSAALREFPGPWDIEWERDWRGSEIKLGLRDESQLGSHTRRLLQEMNSARFLRFLSRLSGMDKLLPDPYLEGASLHQIMPGARSPCTSTWRAGAS